VKEGFNVQSQSNDKGLANDQGLAQARTMHKLSIAAALALFALLVVSFALKWEAYYQVAAGLAAYIAIEWQRRCDRKVKELAKTGTPEGATHAT
jgi:hypothetical protein